MEEKTDEELDAWVLEIIREHEHDQTKQADALYEALKIEPVSTLTRIIGERPIWGLLNNHVAEIVASGITGSR